MKLRHHPNLTEERWAKFPFSQQILMIGTELNRAGNWIAKDDFAEVKRCYERAMELLYLTIGVLKDRKKLCELLRFNEMMAMLYIKQKISIKENANFLKTLLLLDKDSYLLLNPLYPKK